MRQPELTFRPRLLACVAFALLASTATAAGEAVSGAAALAAAPAACKPLSGGRLQGLMPVIWHARTECGGSTLIWFQTLVGKEGANPLWRVDDLLIVPKLEKAQSLSLFAPVDVECRRHSGQPSFVIAAGEWSPRARRGARQPVHRAWRLDPVGGTVEELPAKDVACVLR